MTVTVTPWAIDGKTHPAAEARAAMASLLGGTLNTWTTSTTATDGGHGVVGAADFAVTANGTPNMSVNVGVGSAFVRNGQTTRRETYHVFNDGTVNLAIAAADATNPRRDLIVVQVRDSNFSGANDDARLFVVQGTPAASPADPSLAATPTALVLARIQVNAADTSIVAGDITDLRRVAGGIGSSSGVEAARPAGQNGLRYYATDTFREWRHDGTGWIVMAEPTANYTPTFNGTLGAGTLGGKSHRSDGWCDFEATFTLGAGSVQGTLIGLPFAAAITQHGALSVAYTDGATPYPGHSTALAAAATQVGMMYYGVAASIVSAGPLSAATPFTWGVGDTQVVSGRYRMNTPYL